MKKIYRLKNLALVGVVALLALCLWLAVGWCIPTYHAPTTSEQLYTIRHQDLRDNNPLYIDLLLRSVKQHNGYLVLGTSETVWREKGNYYDFLNTDTSLHCGFSVISGAGKTPCVYFPMIQSNDNVKDLKVIFFLNPSYGCGKLASSNVDYFNRYVSYTAYMKANKPENQRVAEIMDVNRPQIGFMDRVGDGLGYYVDKVRRKYYQDLRFRLNEQKFFEDLEWVDTSLINHLPSGCPEIDSNYNYALNVSGSFDIHSYTLTPHPEETYREEELRTMIQLCRERGVDIVFVAGPYNHIAFAKEYPSEAKKMKQISQKMLQVLQEEGVAYIDCTDLSTVPGTFEDWQHHSSYGAYLIYQKIKDYVLEKEDR